MCTILKAKTVKIRKTHNCWGCANKFPVGTEMIYLVSVDAGDFNSSYWCLPCDTLAQRYSKDLEPCEGFGYGEVASLARQEAREQELATAGGDRQ